jgi:hypothetical protein
VVKVVEEVLISQVVRGVIRGRRALTTRSEATCHDHPPSYFRCTRQLTLVKQLPANMTRQLSKLGKNLRTVNICRKKGAGR